MSSASTQQPEPSRRRRQPSRGWLVDIIIGTLVGGLVGAVISVNIAIFAGPDHGYEATIPEVFEHNPIIGVLALGPLLAGPVLGVTTARQLRRHNRQTRSSTT